MSPALCGSQRRASIAARVIAGFVAACVGTAAAPTSGAQAAGAIYNPLKCHRYQREGGLHTGQRDPAVALTISGQYTARDLCTSSQWRYQLEPSATTYNAHTGPRLRFHAPQGTTLAGFSLQIDARTGGGHWAEVAAIGWHGERALLFRASNQPGGYRTLGPHWGNWARIVVELRCQNPPCEGVTPAHAWVRNVELYVRDVYDPWLTGAGGSLLAGGRRWLRGPKTLTASASDAGGGLSSLRASVNGTQVGPEGAAGCPGALGWPYARIIEPCSASGSLGVTVSTASPPFRDGANEVAVRARDWAGNVTSSATRTVLVDNEPPALAFASAQDRGDPELIRAPVGDRHSGVDEGSVAIALRRLGASAWRPLDTGLRDGALRARVDSAAYPPGVYEFRAEAADVAGNRTVTSERADGEPMRLSFPLRTATELSARLEPSGAAKQTVGYGRRSYVAGRLLDPRGNRLADATIRVVEHFGDGALIRERVSRARTDAEGRWSLRLPAGPSRRVSAHFAGTRRYLPDGARAGHLVVRSRMRFRPSRRRVPEGRTVTFRGRVGRKGARIPVGGKLVEVQVRQGRGRWDTVKRPFHTNNRGRFRLRYRFRRFYVTDTRFRFRARVLRESDWPYRPARSRRRTLTVVAR